MRSYAEQPIGLVDPACPVNWAHPLNLGLIGWWKILPNSGWRGGSKLNDLVRGGKNPHDGTLTGMAAAPTATSGWNPQKPIGSYGSLYYDGTNDYVDCGSISVPANYSIVCRFNQKGNGPNIYGNGIVSRAPASASAGQLFLYTKSTDSKIHFDVPYVVGDAVVSASTISNSIWYHVVLTRIGTTYSIYINGKLDASTTTAGSPTESGSFLIGATWSTPSYLCWNGLIESIKVLNPLNASQVQATYKEDLTGNRNTLNWVDERSYWSTQAAGGFQPAWAVASQQQSRIIGGGVI